MKIKTKKEMNLPQLIEWGWENPKQVERRTFKSDKRDSFGKNAEIYFTNCGHGFYTHRVTDKDTFTVEVEEEITEDTVIPRLVVRHRDTGFTLYENDYINNEFPLDSVQAFYIMNDDLTMKLIWKNGKLVD